MKNKSLLYREWVVHIKHKDGEQTNLHIPMMDAVDILSALAKAHRHIIHDQYAEIISIKQGSCKK